jgi:hypothetical protein
LLAGVKAANGQGVFITVADLFRRYADEVSVKKRGERLEVIPSPIDQNPCAHLRSPMDMMRQG